MAATAILPALAGCVGAVNPVQPPEVTIAGDQVTYRGNFTSDSSARVQAVVGSHRVRTLRISSNGGDVESAIDTALWVHRNGINVIVDGPCLSACANYIFPAGREKHIVEKGIVGWHGNAEHLRYLRAHGEGKAGLASLPAMERLVIKERAFYDEIGVNGYIAWFGKLAPYATWNFYVMSKEDMEYFGLTGLHVRSDYLAASVLNAGWYKKRNLSLVTVNRALTNPADPNWTGRPERK